MQGAGQFSMNGMQFFLYEIVARLVAIYLCFDCYRKLRNGLAERKIQYFNPDFLNWWSGVADRDATPVRYWIQIVIRLTLVASCLFAAIFGWWHPNT
jgi:hypothetical protein